MTALECTEKLALAKKVHRGAIKQFMEMVDKSQTLPDNLSEIERDIALSRRLWNKSKRGSSGYGISEDKYFPEFESLYFDDIAPYWDDVLAKIDDEVREEVKDAPRAVPLSAVITQQDGYILIHSIDLAEIPNMSEDAISSFEDKNERWAVSWTSYTHGKHSAQYSVPTFIAVGMVDKNGENYKPGVPSHLSIFDLMQYLDAISTEDLSDASDYYWANFDNKLMLRFPSDVGVQVIELQLMYEKIQNASQATPPEREAKNAAGASFTEKITEINQKIRDLEKESANLRTQSLIAQHSAALHAIGFDIGDEISHEYRNVIGQIAIDHEGPYLQTEGHRQQNPSGNGLMRELRAGEWVFANTPIEQDRQR